MALRIVFCGTPAFAVPSLQLLLKEPDFEITGVVTQPDRPRGRGQEIQSCPVKDAAVAAGIPVYQPEKIKSDEAHEYFQRQAPDAVVIIAYGQIISPRLLAIPPLGWINLHASLLPKYRGAAPINRAILNGEERTGVTTMLIDAGLDTGPILLQEDTSIGWDETAPQLTFRLASYGAPLVVDTLRGLARGEIKPTPQDASQATLAPPLTKEEGRIDWSLSAQQIYRRMRAFDPWPGTYTSFSGKACHIWGQPLVPEGGEMELLKSACGNEPPVGGRIVLLNREVIVCCGDGTALRLESAKMEGRKRVTAREFAFGVRLASGERFGS
ncbi:MAG TPA: methionyl-tRNA formyltransferase [Verrucomicrobiae bacterium]|nr:methionyl-tRNA formyltransferase [Verrucomicrobiae bacterium]